MISVEFDRNYYVYLKELLHEQPELESEIERSIYWFRKNPDDTRLVNHPLEKKMLGRWAFSVTDDVRIVYLWIGKHSARLLAVGRHAKVYGR